MEAFLINITAFPTLIYSTALIVVIGYWLLVLFGLFDFDMFDIETEAESNTTGIGSVAGLLITLGLSGVPITLVISLLILNGWVTCYFLSLITPSLPEFISILQIIIGIGIAIVGFLIGIPITATMIKPMRKFFRRANQEPVSKSLTGHPCKVRSSRVDSHFGEAECLLHGASLIIKVRSIDDKVFNTGEKAIIIEHQTNDTYIIISEKEFNLQMK